MSNDKKGSDDEVARRIARRVADRDLKPEPLDEDLKPEPVERDQDTGMVIGKPIRRMPPSTPESRRMNRE